MTDNSSLEKYIAYTDTLKEKLDVYFKDQKEFLKCKAGCDICCKSSYYPVSKLEYEYIKIGLTQSFTAEQREKINQAAINILKERRIFLILWNMLTIVLFWSMGLAGFTNIERYCADLTD